MRNHFMRYILSLAVIAAAGAFLFWSDLFVSQDELNESAETEETIFQTKSSEIETEDIRMEETEQKITEAMAMGQEKQRILNLSAGDLAAEGMIQPEILTSLFLSYEIDEGIFGRINGKSFTENEHISLTELSYLKMLYYGFDGNTYVGEMIVNQKIADDVLRIFQTLYENQYPIEKMVLIDEYGADDESSMNENNTSAFNFRTISGSSKLSNHSYGTAIDLNPKYNPYVKNSSDGSVVCQPESGREYADRTKEFSYKIDTNDLAYQLFTQAGFTWGGNWNSVKDYQHFEKED